MLSYVGHKYDDLVNVYCHAHWGNPHPSFRREDVWEAGTMQPMEHPEMLYLPPNLPGSTPKKPEMVRNPTKSNLPDLEEMGHQELVDLVKQLLVERASKPTSLTNPSKCHVLKNFRVYIFCYNYIYETQKLTKVFTCSDQTNAALIIPLL